MANYNLSLTAEVIDNILVWLNTNKDIIIKQSDLLDTTGQSTTATMTQKAITDALGTKADASSVYTKTQTDNLLNAKADKSTTYTKTETDTLLGGKVDKEAGKGLSTNDYTNDDKTKLGGLPTGAELNSELAGIKGEMALPGLAEAVLDTDNAGTKQEFTFRKSGGDGGAFYRKIKGKTLAWNQMFPGWRGGNKAASTSVSATLDQSTNYGIVGHKFFIAFDYWGDNFSGSVYARNLQVNTSNIPLTVTSAKTKYAQIYTCLQVNTFNVYVTMGGGTFYIDNTYQVDLTQMFGAGNEPATVADFEKLFYLPYYAPNAGALIHNATTKIKTVGFNQWDGVLESGYYDITTGQKDSSSSYMRNKNLTPVFSSTAYYIKGTNFRILFYDANLRYIGSQTGVTNAIITTPANARYMAFYSENANVVVGDICINLSNPAKNGTYEPYWEREINLDLTTKKASDDTIPFPNGEMGVGTAQDWADQVGGENVMGVIDLSTLSWTYNTTYKYWRSNAVAEIKNTAATSVANIKHGEYIAVSNDNLIAIPNSISINGTAVEINNGDGGPQPSGLLVFELATPVSFTWKEPLKLGIKVDEDGTEQVFPEQTATPTSAPFNAMTTYTMSIARMVAKLASIQ